MAMVPRCSARHTGAMADEIVPESKDWTWVLDALCPECGFDSSVFAVGDVGSMIRSNAADFAIVLAAPAGELRRRPDPATWSPLEYGAHVRDVYRLFRERLALMLDEDDPLFADWDQDATALAERYGEQDPSVVATELVAAAAVLADAFDAIDGEQWQRPGRRSDGSAFTVDSFARYLIHDPVHHLHDVTAS
jgi:hypothetical protein